jgi:acetyl-CoA carboxylase biotin carboxyl carrier protein
MAGHSGEAADPPPLQVVLLHPGRTKEPPLAEILSFAMPDIEAHITGNVWKIEVAVGDQVSDGDTVAILESMKMEIPVEAEDDGIVKEIRCEEGQSVSEGDVLVVLE